VWLDIVSPDPVQFRHEILHGVGNGLEDDDQQDAVRTAIGWIAERLELGTTHAVAGAPDWIALFESPPTNVDEKLVALGEVLVHVADDARLGKRIPFPAGEAPWREHAFLATVEAEDETAAMALLHGAIAAGIALAALLSTLVRAAMSHYADFGHFTH
jgi:hypothetical protein